MYDINQKCFLSSKYKPTRKSILQKENKGIVCLPFVSHDNASHTPSPANNIPNPTSSPRYATTCTPTRGKNTGVCSSERHQLTAHTPKNVPQNKLFDQQGGMIVAISFSVIGVKARGDVM